jgi:hypothetical protein
MSSNGEDGGNGRDEQPGDGAGAESQSKKPRVDEGVGEGGEVELIVKKTPVSLAGQLRPVRALSQSLTLAFCGDIRVLWQGGEQLCKGSCRSSDTISVIKAKVRKVQNAFWLS